MPERRGHRLNLPQNPLVLAAALFLLGMLLGRALPISAEILLVAMPVTLLGWAVVEARGRRPIWATFLLAATFLLSGATLWRLDQDHVERHHIARLLPPHEELPVTLRLTVLVPPEPSRRGEGFWLGRTTHLLTTTGWRDATGDLVVQWRAGEYATSLRRGDHLQVYGWASRPSGPLNPGGIDRRARLAADRVFAELRVPRPGGVILLDTSASRGPPFLDSARLWLRAKLLEHTLDHDVPAAYALTALLLGYRDPAISDISQAFADAGVAHLLAISGSHIVFFAAIAWLLLLPVPLRPRTRELLTALIVGLYVLATPCGPPIVRAAVALAMVVISRLAGRPGQYLNILAAAAILVVLLRPADIVDAGFQLSFASTAGLILLAPRVYHGLFGRWLERRTLIAELADTAGARRRLWSEKLVCGALVANLVGALTAAPLVAMHFGQANPWAVPAGLLALPVVSAAMIVAAVQLVAETIGLGAAASAPAVFVGNAMIWVVQHLAALPGATLSLRPPPAWSIVLLYASLVLWVARRHLRLSRAVVVNIMLAALVTTAAWYAATAPVRHLEITVLSAGQASSLLVRLPTGSLWAFDAGTPRGALPGNTVRAALRQTGERHLDGLLLSALDVNHASAAGELLDRLRPRRLLVPAPAWDKRGQTLAGATLDATRLLHNTPVHPLAAGDTIALGNGASIDILWPAPGANPSDPVDLIATLSFAGKRLLLADPRAERALALALLANPSLRCDAILFTGPQRGAGDAPLRRIIAPLQATTIAWSSRGPWSPRTSAPGESNAADGALRLTITHAGALTLAPATSR